MSLEPGCYLILFEPNSPWGPESVIYAGTLRVEKVVIDKKIQPSRVSGDLYRFESEAELSKVVPPIANAKGKISLALLKKKKRVPVFPLVNYHCYLEVQQVKESAEGVQLEVEFHKFDALTNAMSVGGTFQLRLDYVAKKPKMLTGVLANGEEERGNFSLHWISPFLRRAELRIALIAPRSGKPIKKPCAPLQKNVSKEKKVPNWTKLFKKAGWDLRMEDRKWTSAELNGPENDLWSAFDLGLAAEQVKKKFEPTDHDWIYYLLCVSAFEQSQFLGIMFDSEATDLNERPRESAAVAALRKLGPEWGEVPCQEAFDGKLYFRTAVHEVGHALNLTHTYDDRSLMNTTDFLLPSRSMDDQVKNITAPEFNPQWSFSPEDTRWLRHASDLALRPGGISRHKVKWRAETIENVGVVALREQSSMTLDVTPVQPSFPFGAPIRLDYTLKNHDAKTQVPADLSLRGGFVSGRVNGPDRKVRYFRSAFRCCDSIKHDGRLSALPPGAAIESSMTLLRGTAGPLFPLTGIYTIDLEVRWDENGQTRRVIGDTRVMIEEAVALEQRRAAEEALNQRFLMPVIVQGLLSQAGGETLYHVLRSEILAPHYRAIALKCFQTRKSRGLIGQSKVDTGSSLGKRGKDRTVKQEKSESMIFLDDIANLIPNGDLESVEMVMNKKEKGQLEALLRQPNPKVDGNPPRPAKLPKPILE